ncbi:unnamed protein product [Malus baccata var. baccata]
MKAAHGGDASPRRRTCRNVCLAATAAVFVATIVLVILCLTVFKAKNPTTTVNSAVLKDLDVSLNIPRVSVDVNLTLGVDLSVKNPNKVGFKYKNSTASLNYRGTQVGEAQIGSGKISADQTKPMNVTLTIMADRLLGKSSELFSDVRAGTLPLNTFTKISGKVIVLGIFKIHVVSTSSCDFSIDVEQEQCMELSKLKTMLKQKPLLAAALAVLGVLLAIFFIMLILGLTKNLDISHQAPKLITVDMSLSIKNQNKVVFKPTKGTAVLFYKGVNVGEAAIEIGKMAPGATINTNVTFTPLADHFQRNPEVSFDLLAGRMPFNTFTKVPGKVKVFGMAKVGVISTRLCGFEIDIRSKTIGDHRCA